MAADQGLHQRMIHHDVFGNALALMAGHRIAPRGAVHHGALLDMQLPGQAGSLQRRTIASQQRDPRAARPAPRPVSNSQPALPPARREIVDSD